VPGLRIASIEAKGHHYWPFWTTLSAYCWADSGIICLQKWISVVRATGLKR
jgi:hypothetical protein